MHQPAIVQSIGSNRDAIGARAAGHLDLAFRHMMRGPDADTQFHAVVKGGRAVATTMLYLADGLAGVYCVATLPDERGKGLAAHLTAETLRRAEEVGHRVGILQSSAAAHSVYLKLGFEDLATVPMFVRVPG